MALLLLSSFSSFSSYGVAHDIRKYSYFSAFPTATKAQGKVGIKVGTYFEEVGFGGAVPLICLYVPST